MKWICLMIAVMVLAWMANAWVTQDKEPERVLALTDIEFSSHDLADILELDAEAADIVFSDTEYDFSFKDGCEIMIELIHENHRFFEKRGFVVTGDKWRADIHPKDAPEGYSVITFTIDKDPTELTKE